MSYRTNRKTRTKFLTSAPTVDGVSVTRLGTRIHPTTVIPWNIEARTKDGRKFNLRVMALSREEALAQARQKFPLIVIRRIYKGRVATARRIGGRLESAGRNLGC